MSDNPKTENHFMGLVIETKKLPVILQTETNRIHGKIHLRENERIKDALNTSDKFIAMTDVLLFDRIGNSLVQKSAFMAINLTKIIWVFEDKTKLDPSDL